MLSRHNFHRTYHSAVAKLADPMGELRPTAARVLKALRAGGPQTAGQLAAVLVDRGRVIRPATIQVALGELVAAGLVAYGENAEQHGWHCPWPATPCWRPWTCAGPMTFATPSRPGWRTPASPARVIDQVMGHETSSRVGQQRGSAMGAHYRHTTPEMAARIATAIEDRLRLVLEVADQALEAHSKRSTRRVF